MIDKDGRCDVCHRTGAGCGDNYCVNEDAVIAALKRTPTKPAPSAPATSPVAFSQDARLRALVDWHMRKLSPLTLKVLLTLLAYSDARGSCTMSVARLCELVG